MIKMTRDAIRDIEKEIVKWLRDVEGHHSVEEILIGSDAITVEASLSACASTKEKIECHGYEAIPLYNGHGLCASEKNMRTLEERIIGRFPSACVKEIAMMRYGVWYMGRVIFEIRNYEDLYGGKDE